MLSVHSWWEPTSLTVYKETYWTHTHTHKFSWPQCTKSTGQMLCQYKPHFSCCHCESACFMHELDFGRRARIVQPVPKRFGWFDGSADARRPPTACDGANPRARSTDRGGGGEVRQAGRPGSGAGVAEPGSRAERRMQGGISWASPQNNIRGTTSPLGICFLELLFWTHFCGWGHPDWLFCKVDDNPLVNAGSLRWCFFSGAPVQAWGVRGVKDLGVSLECPGRGGGGGG